MLPTAIVPDQVDLSYLEALEETELVRQREVVKARQYHEGEQPTFLTERMQEFLNIADDDTFRLNVTRDVVMAVAERLIVSGFDCSDKKQAEWAWALWQANQMDGQQHPIHEAAVRDGEYFVIVHFDDASKAVRFTAQPRYTGLDSNVGGDGFGVTMAYPDDDEQQPPLYALKRWSEWAKVNGKNTLRRRATVYYPERIERFVYTDHWQKYQEPGQPWPVPWRSADGTPLGIPVVHFKNPGLRPEAKDAWPIQNGINKTYIDFLASGDATAFRVFVALGFMPTTDGKALAEDGSNALTIQPGMVIGTTKSKQDADLRAIDPASLAPLMEATQQQMLWMAIATSTPTGRFQSGRQVAAEGTLKQQDDPLISKVELRQSLFGNAWEQCLTLARRQANAFGGAGLDEAVAFKTLWQPAQKRSQKEQQDEWKSKKEQGVPQEQIWAEMGYTPEQITAMKAMPEVQARLALMQAGMAGLQSE